MVALLKRLMRRPYGALHNVGELRDSPHAIALGVAIGLFIGLTPTVGLQMALVLGVGWICQPFLRFNRVAALMAVYVSNPLTMVPLYFAQYQLGRMFVSGDFTRAGLEQILHGDSSTDRWQMLSTLCVDVGSPLLVGTLIMSIAGGLVAYPATRLFVSWYQNRQPDLQLAVRLTPTVKRGMQRSPRTRPVAVRAH